MPPAMDGIKIQIGGAAGYCPPVQKVTDHSSTSIVYPKCLRPLELKDIQKYSIGRVVYCPFIPLLPGKKVSDMGI